MHPYRTRAKSPAKERAGQNSRRDWALAGVLTVVWLLSFFRVLIGVLGHETFGTQGSIALVLVVILPPAIKNSDF